MEVVRYRDASAFAEHVRPLLLTDEPRHNLLLGITSTLVDHPETYPEFHLWLAEDGGRPVAAMIHTPPFLPYVSRSLSDEAIPALATAVHDERGAIPGVSGAVPEVDRFVRAWGEVTGAEATREMAQRIYALRRIHELPPVPGRMRTAHQRDRELLLGWIEAFQREALPPEEVDATDRAQTERALDLRLRGEGGAYGLWEDPGPVAVAGYGGFTPHGARVGLVYTPPEHRGRGYGTAVTAAVSERLLGEGRTFCFLFTDLANPTSNRIYQRIGYEPVCDAMRYRFAPPEGS